MAHVFFLLFLELGARSLSRLVWIEERSKELFLGSPGEMRSLHLVHMVRLAAVIASCAVN